MQFVILNHVVQRGLIKDKLEPRLGLDRGAKGMDKPGKNVWSGEKPDKALGHRALGVNAKALDVTLSAIEHR